MSKKTEKVMPKKPEKVTGVLFLIGEAELEIGKLTAPQLNQWSKQSLVDNARGYLRKAKEELSTMLDNGNDESDEDDVVILDDDTES